LSQICVRVGEAVGGTLFVSFTGRASVKLESNRILFAADMAGTLLFAVEGAISAIGGNLVLLGLMVLAFATALGGGIAQTP
jgi:Glycine transporter